MDFLHIVWLKSTLLVVLFYLKDLDEDDDTDEIKARDQFLFNTLTALKKILQHCNVMRKMQFQDNMNGIWGMFTFLFNSYL